MPTTLPAITGRSIEIRPWTDDVVDRVGFDPRAPYVERFWLGVLGPSTVWLIRRLAAGLDEQPEGFTLPLADTAGALGLGGDGASSPFVRALRRCCQFDLARADGPGALAVRRNLPPLSRRHLLRLPESVQAEHAAWVSSQLHPSQLDSAAHRAERLALSLLELGEDRAATRQQLLRWGFQPHLVHAALDRAVARREATGDDSPSAA